MIVLPIAPALSSYINPLFPHETEGEWVNAKLKAALNREGKAGKLSGLPIT